MLTSLIKSPSLPPSAPPAPNHPKPSRSLIPSLFFLLPSPSFSFLRVPSRSFAFFLVLSRSSSKRGTHPFQAAHLTSKSRFFSPSSFFLSYITVAMAPRPRYCLSSSQYLGVLATSTSSSSQRYSLSRAGGWTRNGAEENERRSSFEEKGAASRLLPFPPPLSPPPTPSSSSSSAVTTSSYSSPFSAILAADLERGRGSRRQIWRVNSCFAHPRTGFSDRRFYFTLFPVRCSQRIRALEAAQGHFHSIFLPRLIISPRIANAFLLRVLGTLSILLIRMQRSRISLKAHAGINFANRVRK
jgi:hypothetical protein